MAQRELDLIAEARITLNDVNKHRWEDKRLMKLLCDAQQEFCRMVPLIVRKTTINTSYGQEEYRLPEDAIKILTARAGGHSLTKTSMEEMDFENPEWEDLTSSSYTHLIVNNLSQQVVRPYPKLSEGAPTVESTIKIRYSAKPDLLGWDEDNQDSENELEVSDIWDYALVQYVISKAFIDYGDESSLSRAQVAQGLYMSVMKDAQRKAKKGFSKRVITTGYQGRTAVTYNTNGVRYGRSYR